MRNQGSKSSKYQPSALAVGLISLTLAGLAAGQAHATTYSFAYDGACGSNMCGATAAFTPGAGMLTVTLTDTLINPRTTAQLLSGIEFTISGSIGSPTLTSQSGALVNLFSNGPATAVSGNPTHWGVGTASGQIVLETSGLSAAGGAPVDMILGPPDKNGNYSNANRGLLNGNFDPYINQTATFVIADSAVTSSTSIRAVTFNFGTAPEFALGSTSETTTTTTTTNAPEPASMTLLGTSLAGLVACVRRRRKRKAR